VFVETKIRINDYAYDTTLHGFDKSAGKLGVDRIMLMLHHALPLEFDKTLEACRALETPLGGFLAPFAVDQIGGGRGDSAFEVLEERGLHIFDDRLVLDGGASLADGDGRGVEVDVESRVRMPRRGEVPRR
jgi:hypothetical protein